MRYNVAVAGSYADKIKELFRRSGLSVSEYAEAIDFHVNSISLVLNDKQPGSRKMLEAALDHAGMTLEDLELPEADASTDQEKALLRYFRRLNEENRNSILSLLKGWLGTIQAARRQAPHK